MEAGGINQKDMGVYCEAILLAMYYINNKHKTKQQQQQQQQPQSSVYQRTFVYTEPSPKHYKQHFVVCLPPCNIT